MLKLISISSLLLRTVYLRFAFFLSFGICLSLYCSSSSSSCKASLSFHSRSLSPSVPLLLALALFLPGSPSFSPFFSPYLSISFSLSPSFALAVLFSPPPSLSLSMSPNLTPCLFVPSLPFPTRYYADIGQFYDQSPLSTVTSYLLLLLIRIFPYCLCLQMRYMKASAFLLLPEVGMGEKWFIFVRILNTQPRMS